MVIHSQLVTRKICPLSQDSLTEANIILFLQGHPNIVTVKQVEITSTTVKTTMDYIPHALLDLIFSFPEGLPPDRVFCIFSQLVNVVKHIHTKGVVHKDLKLENILVDSDDRVVIIDFGFSRFFFPGRQGLVDGNGSLHYSAPEIWHLLPYEGPEVDIWALGVILYLLATGYFPFGGSTIDEVYQNIECKDLWFPSELDDQPLLQDLLSKLLEYDHRKRIQIDGILEHPWMQTSLLGSSSTNTLSMTPITSLTDCSATHPSPYSLTKPFVSGGKNLFHLLQIPKRPLFKKKKIKW
jgi:MAP/microtubule affinity-regulating kinase